MASRIPGRGEPTIFAARFKHFEVPGLVAAWLLGYSSGLWLAASRTSSSAWIWAAAFMAAHGWNNLQAGSRFVTATVTVVAVLGACFRFAAMRTTSEVVRRVLTQAGLFAGSAPLCVVMPAPGAAFFLIVLIAVTGLGALAGRREGAGLSLPRQPLWSSLLAECFPLLSACCFLSLAWQYNAQWLTRGLLIAAGLALLARAALPRRGTQTI